MSCLVVAGWVLSVACLVAAVVCAVVLRYAVRTRLTVQRWVDIDAVGRPDGRGC